MLVQTIISIRTRLAACVVRAFGHAPTIIVLCQLLVLQPKKKTKVSFWGIGGVGLMVGLHVVFVKEFALVAALAESLKPVLADVSDPRGDVFVRAGVA